MKIFKSKLLVLFFIFSTSMLFGQVTLQGVVADSLTREPLIGASLYIVGTSFGNATNVEGEYKITNIPDGEYRLRVSYVGYKTRIVNIATKGRRNINLSIQLSPDQIEGKTIVVTAQAEGQISAVNQQLSSNTIKNVVSEQKIQELPDFNAAEAIGRLPGVSTQRSSGEGNKIVIRGLSPQHNLIAVNGVQLGATNNYDKSVDLSMISPNMLRSIEVFKALTPDMDADAIGGYVNMQLREAPKGWHSDLLWQSGFSKYKKNYENFKAVGQVSNRFFDDALGVLLLGNVEQFDRSADNYNASFSLQGEKEPGQDYAPVYVDNIRLNRHFETRTRYGVNLVLDYKLNNGKLTLINFLSRLNSNTKDYTTTYNVSSNRIDYDGSHGEGNTDMMTNALQGEYDFGFLFADASISNAYSQNSNPDSRTYTFWQETSAFVKGFNRTNVQPESIIGYGQPHIDEWVSNGVQQNGTYLNNLNQSLYNYKEVSQTYSMNLKFPFTFESVISGYVKTGAKFKQTLRLNDQNSLDASPYYGNNLKWMIPKAMPQLGLVQAGSVQRFLASNFSNQDKSLWQDFLENRFGDLNWVPSFDKLDQLVDMFNRNMNTDPDWIQFPYWQSGPWSDYQNDYRYFEKYSASYLMTEINVGQELMILGGIRYENIDRLFDAYSMKNEGQSGIAAKNQQYKLATSDMNNHNLLPMFHVKFKPTNWADIRYAYTKSLSRPSFYALNPRVLINQTGTSVQVGNPDLVPAVSENHDLILSIYQNEIGLFTIGGFYKDVKDFIWYASYPMPSKPVEGFHSIQDFPGAGAGCYYSSQFNNPNKAIIKGIELDWQTRFWYLPSPFDGIVLSINYTRAFSETKYPRVVVTQVPISVPPFVKVAYSDTTRDGRLQDQPEEIVNMSFGYDYEEFSGRISALYTSSVLRGIGTRPEQDSETKQIFRVDVALKQTLPWYGIQVFLNLNNITNRKDEAIQRTIGAPTMQQYYGFTADLGIRYKL